MTSRAKWRAQICDDYKSIYLGYFDTEEEAAKQFDRAALKLRGMHARTNFPRETYGTTEDLTTEVWRKLHGVERRVCQ